MGGRPPSYYRRQRGVREPQLQKAESKLRATASLEEMRPEFTAPESTPHMCHRGPGAHSLRPGFFTHEMGEIQHHSSCGIKELNPQNTTGFPLSMPFLCFHLGLAANSLSWDFSRLLPPTALPSAPTAQRPLPSPFPRSSLLSGPDSDSAARGARVDSGRYPFFPFLL